ncbi:hypothetical protein J3458_018966 [Metarhizium acridum]|uniref:uncharacterized protein n=1 Tax=Metarhizium acridum TaxID=92637 RepID=UPI001C6CD82A|nr:hypothetical protein J3458_018966 [Metarhizium acridum]
MEVMHASGYDSNSMWNDLVVTNYIDTDSVLIAIHSTNCNEDGKLPAARAIFNYIQTLAALQDTCDELGSLLLRRKSIIKPSYELEKARALENILSSFEDVAHRNPVALQIAEIFLSVAWHRSVMILFYMIAGAQLNNGPSAQWVDLYSVAGTDQLRELADHQMRGDADYRETGTTQYLCNWSLELLRRTKPARALDFRRLLNRFSSQFEHEPGRCLKTSSEACKGDDPSSCERFTAAESCAQLAHGSSCSGNCQKIRWNEDSYIVAKGPRAVKVDSDMDCLFYQPASSRTLAISHVWAHGQGGRPEDGINTCLHQRYCGLARRLNCDSYWIDSACIPTDKTLRKKAICSINDVFSTSSAVVGCDKTCNPLT